MTDKDECQHSSWKTVPGGKVACELCGAIGEERHYIKLDDPDLDLSDTFTRMFALAEHWMKRARAAEGIIGGRADYRNELPDLSFALAAAQEREAQYKRLEQWARKLPTPVCEGGELPLAAELNELDEILAALSQPGQAPAQGEPAKRESVQHIDDAAVDRFAIAMKAKMAKSREKGRNGWDDPKQCSLYALWSMLIEHVDKGDPVDVGNFAMMIYNREAAAPKEPK